MELLVASLVLGSSQRLFASESEDSEHRHALIEERVDAMLETLIEIDEDVSAEDHVELAERSVGDEVVLRKHDRSGQRRAEQRAVVLCRVVLGERPPAA